MTELLDWVSAHGSDLNILINLLMLGVWIVYLQVFLLAYRDHRRPAILISRGARSGGALLISNMAGRRFTSPASLPPCRLRTAAAPAR